MKIPILEVPVLTLDDTGIASEVSDIVREHGCVLVSQNGNDADPVTTLRVLSGEFGSPVYHKLSDEHGIHPIRYIPGYPEYANANVEELGLHTDGSFEQNPPAFMLIHCEAASGRGGESTLASGDELYAHLLEEHPDFLRALQLSNAFTIWRDDRTAKRSVFRLDGDRVILAYRSGRDVRINIHPDAVEAFNHVRQWLLDPANFLKLKLKPGETLIFDNKRMLHGRTAFSRDSKRSLHGLWCDGVQADGSRAACGIRVAD